MTVVDVETGLADAPNRADGQPRLAVDQTGPEHTLE
jgi:hypothetical protein